LGERAVQVAKGLYQIKLPIPIRSLGTVFVYFAFESQQNLLIDTGWDSEESYAALDSALSELGFSISDVRKVLISHLHPDHFGLSKRIKKDAPECIFMIHRRDAEDLSGGARDRHLFLSELRDFLKMNGTPTEVLEEMMNPTASLERFSMPSKPDLLLTGGETIKVGDSFKFEIIPTPGHTKGSVCALDRQTRIFFSGDTVLPTITPNVSLSPLYEADPLGDYLNSLNALKNVDTSKILPSHEYVFNDLHERVVETEKHHSERLDDALGVLRLKKKPASGYEIASKLHWYAGSWEKLGPWEKRAAQMETLAHLDHLRRRKQIVRIEEGSNSEAKVLYSCLS
jgi:glyoxylase-like metal-dependent hydrolase (beta-lactamase superfamily II)